MVRDAGECAGQLRRDRHGHSRDRAFRAGELRLTADHGYLGNIPPYAVDEATVAEQAKSAKAVAEQCAANVLVVQNRRDPVTPLRGGELIDQKFGDRQDLHVAHVHYG